MAKTQYRVTNFRAETLARIEQARSIIAEYSGQKLTARQLYYQFVARDLIPNTPRSYQNVTAMLTDARYAGLISWSAIEDRGREVDAPGEWSRIDELVDAAVESWRSPRWQKQPKYVELWVEKQALAGVLSPIARKWHVPLMVNKGYSSASAMYEAAQRMLEALGATSVQTACENCNTFVDDTTDAGKCGGCGERASYVTRAFDEYGDCLHHGCEREAIVLYLGDHDPSGENMVDDIRGRLEEFGVPNLTVTKVGLTMSQIRRLRPPPNPVKLTDSRAQAYIDRHGTDECWELDALPPRELNRLVDGAIRDVCDVNMYEATLAAENVERERVRKAIAKSRKGSKS